MNSVGAGGNNRTRKNLFTFFAGSRIDHSGGIIVEYELLNPEWQYVDGRKMQVYEGYLSSKKIRDNRINFGDSQSKDKCGFLTVL